LGAARGVGSPASAKGTPNPGFGPQNRPRNRLRPPLFGRAVGADPLGGYRVSGTGALEAA